MAKPISHQMDVYSAWIHFARSRSEWKQIRKSTGLPVGKIRSIGLTEKFIDVESGLLQFCVFIDVKSQNPREVAEVCGHEAAHLAGLLLDHVGTDYDGQSETLAYLIGWATGWLWAGCLA